MLAVGFPTFETGIDRNEISPHLRGHGWNGHKRIVAYPLSAVDLPLASSPSIISSSLFTIGSVETLRSGLGSASILRLLPLFFFSHN